LAQPSHGRGDLVAGPGAVALRPGDGKSAWTRDLLIQWVGSSNPLEAAVSRAVAELAPERAIAHAHIVFFLQVHAVAKGSAAGVIPSDGYLAFMMLAANDHIPEWSKITSVELSDMERVLAPMFLSTVFNRSDDTMRSLLRLIDIMGRYPRRDFPDARTWEAVQCQAFGTTFDEYAEMFLTPMHLIAETWCDERVPIVFPEAFSGRDERESALYRRWFREASLPIDKAVQEFATRPLPSGLLGLPAAFFRTPFIDFGDKLVGLSPWHVRDHLLFGTCLLRRPRSAGEAGVAITRRHLARKAAFDAHAEEALRARAHLKALPERDTQPGRSYASRSGERCTRAAWARIPTRGRG
jgi:hypothetical protein